MTCDGARYSKQEAWSFRKHQVRPQDAAGCSFCLLHPPPAPPPQLDFPDAPGKRGRFFQQWLQRWVFLSGSAAHQMGWDTDR